MDSFGEEETLEMLKDSQLVPGNTIKLYNLNEPKENGEIFEVKKVIFSRKRDFISYYREFNVVIANYVKIISFIPKSLE